MTDAWGIAGDNFREDDGSLPALEFAKLSPPSVVRIYDYFRANGQCVTDAPTVWDESLQEDVPLFSIEKPCQLLHDGRIAPFHCCFGGISINGTTVPDLGIFVFPDSVEIDFRMGRCWNTRNVDAFFRLLALFKTLAPEATMRSAHMEGLHDEKAFLAALKTYLPEAR